MPSNKWFHHAKSLCCNDLQSFRKNKIYTSRIWDADSDSATFGRELRKQEFACVYFISDNLKRVVAGSNGGTENNESWVQVWDTDSEKLLTLRPKGSVKNVTVVGWDPSSFTAVSPDSTKMVTVRLDENDKSTVSVWDTDSGSATFGKELRTLSGQNDASQDSFVSALFSPDSTKIATYHQDGTRIWDAQSGKELYK